MGTAMLVVAQFWMIIGIAILVAGIFATNLFVKEAKRRSYRNKSVVPLWFIGICATPIVLGLYVLSLPDPSKQPKAVEAFWD